MGTRKIMMGFAALAFLFAGCSDSGDGVAESLEIRPASIECSSEGDILPVVISSTSDWSVQGGNTWCEAKPLSGKAGVDTLYVTVAKNEEKAVRSVELTITGGSLAQKLKVTQKAYEPDGSYYAYLTASKGKGVKVVVMGDGFTIEDMGAGGKYEKSMVQAVENLLEIEPFKSYRDYFTAWIVRAVSNESGIGDYSGRLDTRFLAKYESATSTAMTCDTAMCFRYACKAPIDNKLDETLIILVTNSSRYAGSTYMYTGGASIAICPMAQKQPYENFKGIIQHEAGGHGFAKLIDEYIYNNETIPEIYANWIKANEQYGFYSNIDLTSDLKAIKWAHFIGQPGYGKVGAYEGGYKYGKGVWRPESISCMDDMRPYFNAPSREAIVKRICQLAGLTYSLADFMANDPSKAAVVGSAVHERVEVISLPAPTVIKGSPALAR